MMLREILYTRRPHRPTPAANHIATHTCHLYNLTFLSTTFIFLIYYYKIFMNVERKLIIYFYICRDKLIYKSYKPLYLHFYEC